MLISWLRIVRAGALFSPGADVVAGMALAQVPWSWDAARTVLASVLTYAAGMALNDFADREEDRRSRPERPLPRGEIRPSAAALLGFALLGAAVALSAVPRVHLLLAALVIGYDFVGKRWAPSALVLMGSLRGTNLLAGAWLATTPLGTGTWLAALGYGLAIAAVTGLGIAEDGAFAPARLVRTWIVTAVVAASLGALAAGGFREPSALVLPAAALLFVRPPRGAEPVPPGRIRTEMLKLLLGCLVYAALLCALSRRWPEAIAILLCAPLARRISRAIAPT